MCLLYISSTPVSGHSCGGAVSVEISLDSAGQSVLLGRNPCGVLFWSAVGSDSVVGTRITICMVCLRARMKALLRKFHHRVQRSEGQ